jgi:histidine ammonia-lyase
MTEEQKRIARYMRSIIEGSDLVEYHKNCETVQDPYSIRCSPQALGGCLDLLDFCREQTEREMDGVTDNPVIIDGEAISGEDFHGAQIAQALDCISMALASISTSSERSGMMLAQAASSASENKLLSHPASVDSIPTSGLQEDLVSMGMNSALKAMRSLKNCRYVVAIELLCASTRTKDELFNKRAGGTMRAYGSVREHMPFLENDCPLHKDIESLYDDLESVVQSEDLRESMFT